MLSYIHRYAHTRCTLPSLRRPALQQTQKGSEMGRDPARVSTTIELTRAPLLSAQGPPCCPATLPRAPIPSPAPVCVLHLPIHGPRQQHSGAACTSASPPAPGCTCAPDDVRACSGLRGQRARPRRCMRQQLEHAAPISVLLRRRRIPHFQAKWCRDGRERDEKQMAVEPSELATPSCQRPPVGPKAHPGTPNPASESRSEPAAPMPPLTLPLSRCLFCDSPPRLLLRPCLLRRLFLLVRAC